MNTTNHDLRSIDAFVDGELDLATRLDLEERMRGDASLAQRVDSATDLRAAIREGADYHDAPAALRRRLQASIGSERGARPRARESIVSVLQRWLEWRPLVAALGAVAVMTVVLGTGGLRGAPDDRLLDDVVASHVRSTLGEHLVDVASSDHHTVKPWLSSKLDFSPPAAELKIPGSTFVGGRVDYLAGRPVAALVYRQGLHVVNSFVWPSSNAGPSAPAFVEVRGYQTAHWSAQGMTHWVVSDVNRAEFGVVVEAIRTADAQAAKP